MHVHTVFQILKVLKNVNVTFFKFCRVVHLVVNLLVQLMLGLPLVMVQRWWRVLIVYIAGVVAGSLGTSVFVPYTRLAGASGGVYAILLAHIASIIMVGTFHRYTFTN
jgi:rhomboid-related protein 1/2/3